MARAERSRVKIGGYALLAGAGTLVAIPAYLMVAPAWRPLVMRLACAVVVMLGGLRIVGSVRRGLEGAPASALDAPPPAGAHPAFDERFLRLRDDVRFSRGSRRYFDTILWPRLRALGATEPPFVDARSAWRRRGVSWRELDDAIADLERRP